MFWRSGRCWSESGFLPLAEVLYVAAAFLVGMVIVFALLRLVAFVIMKVAARLPRFRHVVPRLAIANLHRPRCADTLGCAVARAWAQSSCDVGAD